MRRIFLSLEGCARATNGHATANPKNCLKEIAPTCHPQLEDIVFAGPSYLKERERGPLWVISSSERPRCRTRCPTPSRRIGTTQSGSLLPLPCCRLGATLRQSNSFSAPSAERHPTAGRTMDWRNYIKRAATPPRRARPRLTLPEPGSATASCCRFPISEVRIGAVVGINAGVARGASAQHHRHG